MTNNNVKKSAESAFKKHGNICATRPCEVIFGIITITILMISHVDWRTKEDKYIHPDYHGIDILFMTILRCSAILYTYQQFQSLCEHGSKYMFGIAGLFVLFSSFVFCCTVLKLLDSDVSDLKDAIFFFLLLIDLNKAKFLANCALQASSYEEVQSRIAEGLSLLGPSFTLDTISEALLVGAGTLSGVGRVEQMCGYAVLSILVNYIILVTFFPSCLSFIMELSHRCSTTDFPWQGVSEVGREEGRKSNPILQSVKGIMSAGLFLIHGITRWSFDTETQRISAVQLDKLETKNTSYVPPFIVQWLNAGIDNAVFMVIFVVLLIKYTFFESSWLLHDASSYHSNLGTAMNKSSKKDAVTQTLTPEESNLEESEQSSGPRSLEECKEIAQTKDGLKRLSDDEVLSLVRCNAIPARSLERSLANSHRAVRVRRSFISENLSSSDVLEKLPYRNYDYDKVLGTCCENVIGYVPIPVGVAGPLRVNGREYMVPLSTTEGALVASTSRGCKAISGSVDGAFSIVYKDGMSRGPVLELPSAQKAIEVCTWIKDKNNFSVLESAFNGTSSFARLIDIHVFIAARHLYARFEASTGDAMGMNMVAKGTEAALTALKEVFPELKVISISGNVCTDKKPSAINWILGRGKSVVCDVTIPASVVKSVLKTTADVLVEANVKKNLIGSAIAGSIGGNNAHAANIIAALFIACGQDPAQVVESSSCLTVMERKGPTGEDLYVSVTMPCIEVGTVGGGTSLCPQSACLGMLGVKGPSKESSGDNANRLATVAAATVMAGELSLMASLAEQSLVKSHMALNRPPPKKATSVSPSDGRGVGVVNTADVLRKHLNDGNRN